MTSPAANTKNQLSQTEIEQYHRDGYLIPDLKIPDELLKELRDGLDETISNNPDVRPEQLLGVHIKKGYSGALVGHPAFLKAAQHPALLDILESLIGENIILWATQVICKPGGDGMAVPWHQDGEYWPIRPLNAITVWLALEDSRTENGCMRVIPGSHKEKKLYPHHVSDRADLALNQVLNPDEYSEEQAVNVTLEAGQFSIHDAYLVHGSNPNVSSKRRAGFIPRYMPCSSVYDRTISKLDQLGKSSKSNANYSGRPIWLVRGQDASGLNDFKMGHDLNRD